MDTWDNGEYLTRRLRRLQPESYDEELQKRRKTALRAGFAIGLLSALILFGSGVFAVIGLWPELAVSLLGSLR